LEDEVADVEDNLPIEESVIVNSDAVGRSQEAKEVERWRASGFGAEELHVRPCWESDEESLEIGDHAAEKGYVMGLCGVLLDGRG